jgi:two-component system response regulator PilR (NtrC family)
MAEAPSTNGASSAWAALAETCRRLASADGESALKVVLASALRATGAERGFVLTFPEREDAGKHRVEARVCRRTDGERSPSRSVVRWAASAEAPCVGLDVDPAPDLFAEASVRALRLRHCAAAPIPAAPGIRRSILVDSRQAPAGAVDELLRVLDAHAALAACVRSARPVTAQIALGAPIDRPALVGESAPFLALLEQVRRVAPWRLPVLVTGESGSGKEGIARTLHLDGRRPEGPFVALNCAALPEALLEGELFGAVRGAYTGADQDRPGLFQLASGGTLFLDEVGDMPRAMQAKLLRVLQEGVVRPVGGSVEHAVDVRVVAATHRDLAAKVEAGEFRQDLYFRLAVVELRVPPLRERPDDIAALVAHCLGRLERLTGLAPVRIEPCALAWLSAQRWPGNVRELEAALARALVRASSGVIRACHFEIAGARLHGAEALPNEGLERAMIAGALAEARGSRKDAAALIGWSRQKLYRRMRTLGSRALPPAPEPDAETS